MADFGQTDFGQNWCFGLLAQPQTIFFQKKKKKTRRTNTRGPEVWAGRVGGPKFRAFFCSSGVSLGVFSWEFGGLFAGA